MLFRERLCAGACRIMLLRERLCASACRIMLFRERLCAGACRIMLFRERLCAGACRITLFRERLRASVRARALVAFSHSTARRGRGATRECLPCFWQSGVCEKNAHPARAGA